jgi:hypothetical protein
MTAGNFVRAVPLAIGLSMISAADARIDAGGRAVRRAVGRAGIGRRLRHLVQRAARADGDAGRHACN